MSTKINNMESVPPLVTTGNGVQKQEPDEGHRTTVATGKQPKQIHYVNPFVHKLIWDDPIDKVKVSYWTNFT